MQREPLIVECENLKKKQVTKRKKEKLVKVNHILGHFEWIITNFASKFNLQVEGLYPSKTLSSFPTSKKVVSMFGKRQQNG